MSLEPTQPLRPIKKPDTPTVTGQLLNIIDEFAPDISSDRRMACLERMKQAMMSDEMRQYMARQYDKAREQAIEQRQTEIIDTLNDLKKYIGVVEQKQDIIGYAIHAEYSAAQNRAGVLKKVDELLPAELRSK